MQLTLLESDRSFFNSAECAVVSLVAHVGVVWFALAATNGAGPIPAAQRDVMPFYLIPPDRVKAQPRQPVTVDWGRLGADLADGAGPAFSGDGGPARGRGAGTRLAGEKAGAKGSPPVGPEPVFQPDSVFSVLQVDQMVERFEGSAAPVYPPQLIAKGTEGQVDATYVVDTLGQVDTTTIHVLQSDDSLFTESVRDALGDMRFRPAKRGGRPVRQLVGQRFRFRLSQQARANIGGT